MMNIDIMNKAGFREQMSEVLKGNCPFCCKEVSENDFRDELSKREFDISGICQECQDKIFSNEDCI
jgi:hypothetical protein